VNPVTVDFNIRWALNPERLVNDPLAKGVRNLGRFVPLRVYLEPANELIGERTIDLYDPYYIAETHHFELDDGRWTFRIEDPTGWISYTINDMKLNGVPLNDTGFTLG
jgi:hypothetical protein